MTKRSNFYLGIKSKEFMPKIAITGASGHLGTAIVYELLKNDSYEIRAQYHSKHPNVEHTQLKWVKGDLSEASLKDLIQDADFVIHCAAIISITGGQNGKVHATNVGGTERVANICVEQKVGRLIHVSSTHALQEIPRETIFDENRPHKSSSDFAYDYSKACSEQVVQQAIQEHGLDAIIVRPSSMVGPPDFKPSLLGAGIASMSKMKIPAIVKGGYDFVDVRDVARSIVSALTNGRSGESYNLTGTYHEIRDLARIVAETAKVRPPRFVVPNSLVLLGVPFIKIQARLTRKPPKFTRESIEVLKNGHPNMSGAKAHQELGHASRPLEASIQDLLDWFNDMNNR